MRRTSIIALFVVLLAMAVPCFGQEYGLLNSNSSNSKGCDLSGTWYGGSDMALPYKMTIEPIEGDRYSVRFQQAIDFGAFGILGWTDWTGVITKVRDTRCKYDVLIAAFYVLSPDAAAQLGGSLDMDVVHSTIEFGPNCNTIQHTIDMYGGYIPWTADKVPFVTKLDYDYLALYLNGNPLQETYYRMSTTCPICRHAGH